MTESGLQYWSHYAQAGRIIDDLRDVLGMLERNEVVHAYRKVERVRSDAVSLWSDLRPEDATDE